MNMCSGLLREVIFMPMTREKYDIVYKTVGDAIRLASVLVIVIIIGAVSIVNPINAQMRPEMQPIFSKVRILAYISIGALLFLHFVIARSRFKNSSKAFLYAFIMTTILNAVCLIAIDANNIIWSGLVLSIMISMFMFKRYHALVIQGVSVLNHFYLLVIGGLRYLIIAQKIALSSILLMSIVIAFIGRRAFKSLIESLSDERDKLMITQDELQSLNDQLEIRVQERTIELENMTEELKATLNDLKSAQTKIIRNESMKSYLALTRGISHQMNTPLGILLTTTTFLNESVVELKSKYESGDLTAGRFSELLAHIEGGVELLEGNVNRSIMAVEVLKRFSDFEETKNVDVRTLLDHLVSEVNKVEAYSALKVEYQLEDELELCLPENHFIRVLLTLLDNSVKYTNKPITDVAIGVSCTERDIKFTITDNGPGINHEDAKRIFEPYFTTDPHSLGMGLFLAENVLSHTFHGTLKADLSCSEGACFVISLPKDMQVC